MVDVDELSRSLQEILLGSLRTMIPEDQIRVALELKGVLDAHVCALEAKMDREEEATP